MEIREIVNRLNDIHKEANEYDNAVCYVTSDDNEVIEAAIKKLEQLDFLYKSGLFKDCESCKAESTMSGARDDIPTQKSVPPMPRKNVSMSNDTIKEQRIWYWIETGMIYMTEEEKAINRLVDILSEVNRTGDAVCYITSEDNETIKTAIKALSQESCEDAVSRQAVDRLVWKYLKKGTDENIAFYEHFLDLPSVTPKPKIEHWIEITNNRGTVIALRCSCCEKSPKHAIKSDFCPNCGAKMIEPQAE